MTNDYLFLNYGGNYKFDDRPRRRVLAATVPPFRPPKAGENSRWVLSEGTWGRGGRLHDVNFNLIKA